MGTVKHNYEYLNTGRTVRLLELLVSEDIGGKDLILIYNAEGKFIRGGHWADINLAGWLWLLGEAIRCNPDYIVKFKLRRQTT